MEVRENSNMATNRSKKTTKKEEDPVKRAYDEAEKDILKDPDLSDEDPTDDLDEGELARRDNSDEEAVDQVERRKRKEK